MRELADDALASLLKSAVLDGYANGHHQAESDLTATAGNLIRWMTPRAVVNPHYAPTAEMAQGLVIMAALMTDEYEAFAKGTGKTDASTYDGFLHLATIIGGLGDDHDYLLDTNGPLPALKFDVPHAEGVVGATPKVVFEAIAPIVSSVTAVPAP